MPPIMPPADMDLMALAPLLVVAVTAMVALLMELPLRGRDRSPIAIVSIIGVAVAALTTIPLWNAGRAPSYTGMWLADNLAVFIIITSLVVTFVALLVAPGFLARTGMDYGEFYALLLLALCGMIMLAGAGNLIIVFLGIELLSISLYILSGFARGQLLSAEAALKYFLLGSFSMGFFIYGSALIYGATGTTDLAAIGAALATVSVQDNPLVLIGMGLLLVGIAFKLSLVPFHQWTPDVYDGAPTLVTAFMSVGTKAAVFAALIRVLAEALPSLRGDWSMILWVLAAATMLVGNIAAVAQTEIKRLLAYSSVGQAGYILTAAYAGSTDGWSAVLFYLFCYAFMNLGAFAVVIALGLRGEANRRTSDYGGLFQRHPGLAIAMTIFLLSLAGVPPTAGFWAKFYAFSAAIGAGAPGLWLALIGVVSSVIAAYYYLRIVIIMYRAPDTVAATPRSALGTPAMLTAAIVLALVLTLQIGLFPAAQLSAAQAAAPPARTAAR
ncbi:MAG: NADH-quinone oxidoreductase subunit N [Chloroflexi bacterium]|nr:NADH-quinone oxidoreductase subunit N [Chloroflexota bacterium]